MPQFNFQDFDNNAWAANERIAAQVKRIFEQSILEACALAVSLKRVKEGVFSFSQYPQLLKQVNKIFQRLARKVEQNIVIGNQQAWSLSIKKNDELVKYLSAQTSIPKRIIDRFDPRNTDALTAFQNRKDKGMNLSQRVWKITQQSRQEMELAIDQGLGMGKSAAQLSRSVRKLLQEPDNLFRRVRDKHGQLQLSKRAAAYHPGQGVYRSSYKNAMRLTRTENNMAYREADFDRWNALDFVVGVEVRLSNNPKHCPMCVQLAGKYPKEFKFVGWHPQCRCFAIPVLMTDREFGKLSKMRLDGDDPDSIASRNRVSDVPDNFRDWVRANKDRVSNWASMPYFVLANFAAGDISAGLQFAATKPPTNANRFLISPESRAMLAERGFVISGGSDELNKYLAGFDFLEFDQEMLAIVDPYGIEFDRKIIRDATGAASLSYIDDADRFKLKRNFFINQNGQKTVEHAYFQLDSDLQGEGISKSVFKALYKQYLNAGVQRIEVHANIDVGGYTWGKYGFAAKSKGKISDVIWRAERRLDAEELADFNKWIESCEKAGTFPMRELADKPYGKRVMLGSDWFGYIDLTDTRQRRIFEDYLGL